MRSCWIASYKRAAEIIYFVEQICCSLNVILTTTKDTHTKKNTWKFARLVSALVAWMMLIHSHKKADGMWTFSVFTNFHLHANWSLAESFRLSNYLSVLDDQQKRATFFFFFFFHLLLCTRHRTYCSNISWQSHSTRQEFQVALLFDDKQPEAERKNISDFVFSVRTKFVNSI